MNRATLIGRLTRDPELKTTPTGKLVASASIATSEKYVDKEGNKQEKTEFHNIVIWGKQAEIFCKYVNKGKLVMVDGKITTRSWEKDGIKRYSTEVLVNSFEFLSPADKQEASKTQQSYTHDDDFNREPDQVLEDEQAPIDLMDCPF